jgi:hypothetical protein
MKRILFLFLICTDLFLSTVSGQTTKSNGISYQAIARDAQGAIIANAPVALKISFFVKNNGTKNYYTEIHQLTTDENGLINLVIGNGNETVGAFEDIPWDAEQVWLNVEMDAKGGNNFALVGSTELYVVPYAYHAATASELIEDTAIDLPTEKAQSTNWLIGGNDRTRPEIHFVGTGDSRDFVFKTNNVTRLIVTKNGQLQVKSGVTGSKDDEASYAVTVEGSIQGIYIKVTGKRSSENKFMTFADDENIWGGIEGQTLKELNEDSEYGREKALYLVSKVALAAKAIAVGIKAYGFISAASTTAATVIFGWSAPGWSVAAGGAFAQIAGWALEVATLDIEHKLYLRETEESIGISYSSGAGDYAEWLQRAPGVKPFDFGEIVGVNGGKVSLDTKNAQHFMVVSRQPIVLGNAPQEKFKKDFEKIAFMGQVPVKVAGKVEVGDYIIPSGNNDGFGIAVNPKAMKIGDFAKIVGVAWQSAKEHPFNLVNVAVGLSNNDLVPKVDEISTKVDNIIAYLGGKGPLRPENSAAIQEQPLADETSLTKQLTDEEFDQFVDQHAADFIDVYANVKLELIKKGYDMSKYNEINAFLDNPLPVIKQIRRNPSYATQWRAIDAILIKQK